MQKFATWARRGLVALAPLPLVFAVGASAAGNDVSPALRAAMMRDLGMTSAQVSQYMKVERLATLQAAQLEKDQGRHFAGSWIERQADGSHKLVVATTRIGPQKGAADVEIRNARNSLADLNASKGHLDTQLARGAKVPAAVNGWYVDVQANSVVVSHVRGGQKAAIDYVAASGADARHVRFVVEEKPQLHGTLKGGLGYLRNPGDGYLYACSIGFNVTKGTVAGYATAGHCGDVNEKAYFEGSAGTGPQWTLGAEIGTFQASSFPNPGQTGTDMGWVATSAGHTSLATVHGWTSADVTVKGATRAIVGAAVCRSGRTTQWRCGAIQAWGQTVNYGSGETITNLTRTSACSEGGDSGGSFITSAGQAQGVLSGGSGSCKGGGRRSTSYFQPIDTLLSAYGLTLKTG